MKKRTFKPGTVVVFDPESFTKEFWGSLSEKDRVVNNLRQIKPSHQL